MTSGRLMVPDTSSSTAQLALPERARLLHIGIPKTGTTALQAAASASRPALLEHGVRYPGRHYNHLYAASALMARPVGSGRLGQARYPRAMWDELKGEIDADPRRRAFISHEFISECDDEQARRFADELGDDLHVVVTLRGFADLLPSVWQQYVKAGMRADFDWWLRHVLDDPPRTTMTPTFYTRNDQAGVVRRWASVAGADNVTVVVLDKARPTLLFETFERLLDLPDGLLRDAETDDHRANRGLSAEEAFLLMELNRRVHEHEVAWSDFHRLVRLGSVERMLSVRRPGPDEQRLVLPAWAAERALVTAARYAEAIEATGVRVVGDLALLSAPVETRGDEPLRVTSVAVESAAEALSGLLSAALWRGSTFGPAEPQASDVEKAARRQSRRLASDDPAVRRKGVVAQTRELTSRELLAVVGIRLRDRLAGRLRRRR